MADKVRPVDAANMPSTSATSSPLPAAPNGNPVFRMMGLPNFRLKLPSRNWLIFLSISGSFTSLVLYDRHQKKRAQQKWCTLVSHVASEPLPPTCMPRKLTVYLAAPPGDSLSTARDYFKEYVKPILVSAALDWDVVEGRREGDVRAGLAERVRKFRRRRGEGTGDELEEDVEHLIEQLRLTTGIQEANGVKGDIIIGRHTWKEYMRGLHEGWLGPLDPPSPPVSQPLAADDAFPMSPLPPSVETLSSTHGAPDSRDASGADDASPIASPPKEPPTEPAKPPKSVPSTPYIPITAYAASDLPQTLPPTFDPSMSLPFPHILGFFNTPIRIYRFLTRRYLADAAGRNTAAVVLAESRPFNHSSSASTTTLSRIVQANDEPTMNNQTDEYEQQGTLGHEEVEWPKSVRKRKEEDGERVWLDDIAVDPRIAGRMRKFQLDPTEESRANLIADGKAEMLAELKSNGDGIT